jgi:hypothetical protein
MSESPEQLLARQRHDIDRACSPASCAGVRDITKQPAFKKVAKEMIELCKAHGIWDECKAKLLASGVEFIETKKRT